MASRQFTVDSAKKKEFINIFLLKLGGGVGVGVGGGGNAAAVAWRDDGGSSEAAAAVARRRWLWRQRNSVTVAAWLPLWRPVAAAVASGAGGSSFMAA